MTYQAGQGQVFRGRHRAVHRGDSPALPFFCHQNASPDLLPPPPEPHRFPCGHGCLSTPPSAHHGPGGKNNSQNGGHPGLLPGAYHCRRRYRPPPAFLPRALGFRCFISGFLGSLQKSSCQNPRRNADFRCCAVVCRSVLCAKHSTVTQYHTTSCGNVLWQACCQGAWCTWVPWRG